MDESIKEKLDALVERYNTPGFIELDPVSIPHGFTQKEDIEISGFLVATMAWGNRKSILNSGRRLLDLMDNAPYDFVLNHVPSDLKRFEGFVHRTFNGIDVQYFLTVLKHLYLHAGGLELAMTGSYDGGNSVRPCLENFHLTFFQFPHLQRTRKHLANPKTGSAAKRLNMFLRWMIRKDERGVDFGIWKNLPMAALSIPLDVHTGNQARKMGLLCRKQNDWKSVDELDTVLRQMDPIDPVKYDYALFGLGVNPMER